MRFMPRSLPPIHHVDTAIRGVPCPGTCVEVGRKSFGRHSAGIRPCRCLIVVPGLRPKERDPKAIVPQSGH